ncbi:HupE/UreJ family protein [Streptomyces sp. NPDC059629]|uniref:HupE/UreJ family protein n=1 Tax=Streptomyces sp. NPDC059629 TaxID=3346889 RepID=UPI00367EEEDB
MSIRTRATGSARSPASGERIRLLLAWAGTSVRAAGGGLMWYDTAVLGRLLTEDPALLLAACAAPPLSAAQLDGAAELFATLEWTQVRGEQLPEPLRSLLIDHIRTDGTRRHAVPDAPRLLRRRTNGLTSSHRRRCHLRLCKPHARAAVRPLFPGREAVGAGIFGLGHGLAFSLTLAEMHLSTSPLALSLAGFSFGIECMQLLLVLLALPSLICLTRLPRHSALRTA